MTPATLTRVLAASPLETAHLALAALEAGARAEVWDDPNATAPLVSLYSRRQRLVRRVGQPSIGFAEAVDHLRATEALELLMGYVDDRPRGGWYFQLFLIADGTALLACFGVGSPRRRTTAD